MNTLFFGWGFNQVYHLQNRIFLGRSIDHSGSIPTHQRGKCSHHSFQMGRVLVSFQPYITLHHIKWHYFEAHTKIPLHYITLHNITVYHIIQQNFQDLFLLKATSHYISVLNSDRPCLSFFFSSLHYTHFKWACIGFF